MPFTARLNLILNLKGLIELETVKHPIPSVIPANQASFKDGTAGWVSRDI